MHTHNPKKHVHFMLNLADGTESPALAIITYLSSKTNKQEKRRTNKDKTQKQATQSNLHVAYFALHRNGLLSVCRIVLLGPSGCLRNLAPSGKGCGSRPSGLLFRLSTGQIARRNHTPTWNKKGHCKRFKTLLLTNESSPHLSLAVCWVGDDGDQN